MNSVGKDLEYIRMIRWKLMNGIPLTSADITMMNEMARRHKYPHTIRDNEVNDKYHCQRQEGNDPTKI